MFYEKHVFRRPLTLVLAFLMCAIPATPMVAADDPAPVSENVTDNLVNRLVERGVITKQDADELLKQAEEDAAAARAQTAAKQLAAAKEAAAIQVAAAEEAAAKQVAAAREIAAIQIAAAKEIAAIEAAARQPAVAPTVGVTQSAAAQTPGGAQAAPSPTSDNIAQSSPAVAPAPANQIAAEGQVADAHPAQPQPAAAQPAPAPDDDTVRVTYVPEVVKNQLREEIKQDVMAEARKENWASPGALPAWVSRFNPFGDIRIRYDGNYYPTGNDNTGAFPNFNAINTGAPFDTTGTVFSPQYNVDQTRTRLRLRARFGVAVDLDEGFTSGLRLATGENDSPVTENQSLGAANSAQGGDFSKYAIWLDRAFLKYEIGGLPDKDLSVTVGRFDNPFLATSIIWADDLGFDGAAVQGKYPLDEDVTPFFAAGAFPVFNTDLNFASNQPAKFKSEDKWLYAGQLGFTWEFSQDFSLKTGTAYYYFDNIEGKLSDPFTPVTASDAGNTDDSRPSFAQRGNTYMALRDIVPNSLNNFGTIDQFQYFGLATPFHELALTAQLDYNHFEPFQVSLSGEYVNNLAFHQRAIAAKAVNNLGSNGVGDFAGGDAAWIMILKVGKAALEKRWDWNFNLSYRRVESDAVVDGFCDSDFGGGGTNLKGYTFAGNLALSSRVWLGLRWMSADAIAGPPYKNDTLQFDINGKL
jgi:hypothetical protein